MGAIIKKNFDAVLLDLADEINREHKAVGESIRTGLEHALRVGQLLIGAKSKLKHGEWLPWLEANCEFSRWTAAAYIRLWEHRDALESNVWSSTHLTIDAALKMLAKPKAEQREEGTDYVHRATDVHWNDSTDSAPVSEFYSMDERRGAKPFTEPTDQQGSQVSEPRRPENVSIPKFNQTNDSIEWAKWTWNPVTGCKHGCEFCYARDIANRFTGHFEPKFHPQRLAAPMNTPVPKSDHIGDRNVFVCSMADLFGDWVPDEWIEKTLEAASKTPRWNYLFLTKNPRRYIGINWPKNAWIGASGCTQEMVDEALDVFRTTSATVLFLSCEPLLGPVLIPKYAPIDWVIIGAQRKTSALPEFQPEWGWVQGLEMSARANSLPVYFKPNLILKRPREYPDKIIVS